MANFFAILLLTAFMTEKNSVVFATISIIAPCLPFLLLYSRFSFTGSSSSSSTSSSSQSQQSRRPFGLSEQLVLKHNPTPLLTSYRTTGAIALSRVSVHHARAPGAMLSRAVGSRQHQRWLGQRFPPSAAWPGSRTTKSCYNCTRCTQARIIESNGTGFTGCSSICLTTFRF